MYLGEGLRLLSCSLPLGAVSHDVAGWGAPTTHPAVVFLSSRCRCGVVGQAGELSALFSWCREVICFAASTRRQSRKRRCFSAVQNEEGGTILFPQDGNS